jgi:hypothetical protein
MDRKSDSPSFGQKGIEHATDAWREETAEGRETERAVLAGDHAVGD